MFRDVTQSPMLSRCSPRPFRDDEENQTVRVTT